MLDGMNCYWKKLVLALSFAGWFCSAHAADTKPEDIVAHHLDSIGTAEARAAVRSRAVQGTLRFKVLIGGNGEVVGTWGRVSEQRKSNFVMRFGDGDWRGEQFIFDGDKTSFAAATSATVEALQNFDRSRVKLDYIGLMKVDGRELPGIEYHSKGNTDMTVKLYFEPDTYHHVMTIYSVSMAPNMGSSPTDSVNQREIRYTIEERFSDFQKDNGITLPRHYNLQYTQELQSGSTRLYDWDMTVDKILNNLDLDPGNFRLK